MTTRTLDSPHRAGDRHVRDGYKHDLSMVMGTNFADNAATSPLISSTTISSRLGRARELLECALYSTPSSTG